MQYAFQTTIRSEDFASKVLFCRNSIYHGRDSNFTRRFLCKTYEIKMTFMPHYVTIILTFIEGKTLKVHREQSSQASSLLSENPLKPHDLASL